MNKLKTKYNNKKAMINKLKYFIM